MKTFTLATTLVALAYATSMEVQNQRSAPLLEMNVYEGGSGCCDDHDHDCCDDHDNDCCDDHAHDCCDDVPPVIIDDPLPTVEFECAWDPSSCPAVVVATNDPCAQLLPSSGNEYYGVPFVVAAAFGLGDNCLDRCAFSFWYDCLYTTMSMSDDDLAQVMMDLDSDNSCCIETYEMCQSPHPINDFGDWTTTIC